LPELTWQPQFGDQGVSYDDVISGKHDQYLISFARSVNSFGSPLRISLAPEMNSEWVSWGIGKNGNTPEKHKLFWQHVVNIFRAENVSNVEWIWSPNVRYYNDPCSYSEIFPGNDYIDYLGLDGYNWGTSQSWSVWQSFSDVFSRSYNELIALSSKNILIMEVASTEAGGNKANWIIQMFSDLRNKFPRIAGFTWFSINKETDWRIDSSQASMDAFKKGYLGETSKASYVPPPNSSSSSSTVSAGAVNKKGSKEYQLTVQSKVPETQIAQEEVSAPKPEIIESSGQAPNEQINNQAGRKDVVLSENIALVSAKFWTKLHIPLFESLLFWKIYFWSNLLILFYIFFKMYQIRNHAFSVKNRSVWLRRM